MSGDKKKSQSEQRNPGSQAQTFTLRIWVTHRKGAVFEWRGRIQHIQSGDVKHCQNWNSFIAFVEERLFDTFEKIKNPSLRD